MPQTDPSPETCTEGHDFAPPDGVCSRCGAEPEPLPGVPHFTADSLAGFGDNLTLYRKREPTRAIRISGPFTCETIDGNFVSCEDGYLAFDGEGHPYPIAKSIFEGGFEAVPAEGSFAEGEEVAAPPCGAMQPSGDPFMCSLPAGHAGTHEARRPEDGHLWAVWG